MSPHCITGLSYQSSRNSGNKFRLASPLTPPNLVALEQQVCEISVVEQFCSRKCRPKFTLGHQIFHQSIGCTLGVGVLDDSGVPWPQGSRYTYFYRHSVVTLTVDRFVSEISLVLYRKCHFCTYTLVFHPKFGDVPHKSKIDEQCSAVSRVLWLISRDITFGEH